MHSDDASSRTRAALRLVQVWCVTYGLMSEPDAVLIYGDDDTMRVQHEHIKSFKIMSAMLMSDPNTKP